MRRIDIITGLNRAIRRRVPKAHQAEVRSMQEAITHIWTAAVEADREEAYAAGVKAAEQRHAESQESGWQLGYRHGLDRAIGTTGSPARRLDDDDLTMSPS